MAKKIIIVIIALILVVAIAFGVYYLVNNNKDNGENNNTTSENIDLQAINNEISSQPPFSELATMDITLENLPTLFNINADEVEEVVGKMAMMNVQASRYFIIKAKDGAVDSVRQQVEDYGNSYEQQWATYLPEQYELVKQRKIGTIDNYVYFIVAENAQDLEALIK